MHRLLPSSLKGLFLFNDSTFLVLVVVTATLTGLWGWFWTQSSQEAARIETLTRLAERVRGDMYRQLHEVTHARLTENPAALHVYAGYRHQIAERFEKLRVLAQDRNELAAVDYLHDAYEVVLEDMEKVFTDPNEITEATRMKLLDPAYEEWMLSELESALKVIDVIVERRRQELDAWRSNWTRWTPIVVPVSVVFAVALLLFSRRILQARFVAPLRNLVDGTVEVSRGNLEHRFQAEGVEEIRQLASTFDDMTRRLAESQRVLVESERQAALGALVPVVAHNVRNPLASIRATAQMMDAEAAAEDIAESRSAIIGTVDRLERWVTALLSYLVPLRPRRRECRLGDVVEGALGPLQPKIERKGLGVMREDWEQDMPIQADPDLLEQAVHALLGNAVGGIAGPRANPHRPFPDRRCAESAHRRRRAGHFLRSGSPCACARADHQEGWFRTRHSRGLEDLPGARGRHRHPPARRGGDPGHRLHAAHRAEGVAGMQRSESPREPERAGPNVLVVDDEELFARAVGKKLRRSGVECELALDIAGARDRLARQRPDLMLLDVRLPDGSGLDFLRELRAGAHADLPVLVLTAFGGLQDAVAAMKERADDYLTKPIDLDELMVKIERVLGQAEVSRRLEYSRQREQRSANDVPLVGTSAAMNALSARIVRIQRLASHAEGVPPTVLIQGETGTGKDLAARALHRGSDRAGRPFVHVDCAALPKDLIEAELFGHEKGAFTHAHAARTGLIEAAENGHRLPGRNRGVAARSPVAATRGAGAPRGATHRQHQTPAGCRVVHRRHQSGS